MNIPLEKVRQDGGTQMRAQINLFTVGDYAEQMRAGAKFPDVVLFFDDSDYWLADGFHRVQAAMQAGLKAINADVRQGTKRDAILYSVSANNNHGLRRTNEDKRRAALTLLNDEEWSKWSDNRIAKQCGVSQQFVSSIRQSHTYNDCKYEERVFIHPKTGQPATMQTANIGKPAELQSVSLIPDADENAILEAAREIRVRRAEENARRLEIIKAQPVIVPAGKFQCIVIDPPWDWGDEGDVDQFGRGCNKLVPHQVRATPP